MRASFRPPFLAVAVLLVSWLLPGAQGEVDAQEGSRVVIAAREPAPYVGPNRPWWKYDEIRAMHQGKQSWTLDLVEDEHMKSQYISMAPGESTQTKMYGEHPMFFIVQEGALRVEIDGHEPFIASKNFAVQVPFMTFFKLTSVGNEPSLRFEVTIPNAVVFYPVDETPAYTAGPGHTWQRVTIPANAARGSYEVSVTGARGSGSANPITPYFDFNEVLAQGDAGRARRFVSDHRLYANINRSPPQPAVPDTDWGHYHADYGEMWFILEGEIDYLMEGVGFFTATQGDVVYATRDRFHRPRVSAQTDRPATRVAINPFVAGLHVFQADEIPPPSPGEIR